MKREKGQVFPLLWIPACFSPKREIRVRGGGQREAVAFTGTIAKKGLERENRVVFFPCDECPWLALSPRGHRHARQITTLSWGDNIKLSTLQ